MSSVHAGDYASVEKRYRALLAVSEAIASHRELQALFRELVGRLEEVVSFAVLGVMLYDAANAADKLLHPVIGHFW